MNCCSFYGKDLVDFHQYTTNNDWEYIKRHFQYFMSTPSARKKICISVCSPSLVSALTEYSTTTNVTDLEISDRFLFRNYVKCIANFCLLHDFQNIIFKSAFEFHDIEPFLKLLSLIKVKRLTFQGNKLSKKMIKMLSQEISENTVELDLSMCSLTNSCMFYLSRYLKEKKSIKRLHLNSNRFYFDGVNHLSIAIPDSNLISLNLYGNRIGNCGIEILLKHIPQCKSLRELGLSKTYISSNGFRKLCLALPNMRLTSLSIADNFISEKDIQENLLTMLPLTFISKLSWFSILISFSSRIELQKNLNKILQLNWKKQKNHNNSFQYDLFLIQLNQKFNRVSDNALADVFGCFELSSYIKSFLLFP